MIEVTENELAVGDPATAAAIAALRARGAALAVDDTGAGYAGLTHVMRLAPDVIKLDRALTTDIDSDPVKAALVSSFVRYARDIDATVCAEGIETAAELARLAELDVAFGQGFHIGRPSPPWISAHPEPAAASRASFRAAFADDHTSSDLEAADAPARARRGRLAGGDGRGARRRRGAAAARARRMPPRCSSPSRARRPRHCAPRATAPSSCCRSARAGSSWPTAAASVRGRASSSAAAASSPTSSKRGKGRARCLTRSRATLQRMSQTFPLPGSADAVVAAPAPGQGPQFWAGAPSAVLDADGTIVLGYRVRNGPDTTDETVLARSRRRRAAGDRARARPGPLRRPVDRAAGARAARRRLADVREPRDARTPSTGGSAWSRRRRSKALGEAEIRTAFAGDAQTAVKDPIVRVARRRLARLGLLPPARPPGRGGPHELRLRHQRRRPGVGLARHRARRPPRRVGLARRAPDDDPPGRPRGLRRPRLGRGELVRAHRPRRPGRRPLRLDR